MPMRLASRAVFTEANEVSEGGIRFVMGRRFIQIIL
jgi:hypothetical protein